MYSSYTYTHKCVGHADVADTALPCIEQSWQVQFLQMYFDMVKNSRVVYYPVGGSPSTKNNCGDTAKARMPTY